MSRKGKCPSSTCPGSWVLSQLIVPIQKLLQRKVRKNWLSPASRIVATESEKKWQSPSSILAKIKSCPNGPKSFRSPLWRLEIWSTKFESHCFKTVTSSYATPDMRPKCPGPHYLPIWSSYVSPGHVLPSSEEKKFSCNNTGWPPTKVDKVF